jgi:predicted membrane protein
MSIGDLTVDLTNTVLDSDTEIDANVGIGSVTVVVPADAVVSVDASASAGEVTVFGRKDDGVDAHVSENSIPPGALQSGTVKTIQIDTHVGLGNVSVSRIPR